MIVSRTHDAGVWIDGLDQTLDLRRKQSRSLSTRVIRRAHWLDPYDREIALAYFDRGMKGADIGALLNIDPRHVRKRIKQIVLLLEDPRCAYVVAHRNAWSSRRRMIAEDLFVKGRSMREVSESRGISLHAVRKHRDAIDAMASASLEQGRPSRSWQHAERDRS